jgi:peptidoglycan/LPS O-acetylase OafA/YrhL
VLFGMLALTPLLHLEWHRGHIAYFFYLGNVAANAKPSLEYVLPSFSLLHLWSLSVEEQFYLLWPMAIYFAATPRRVLRLCLGLSLFALLARIAFLHWLPESLAVEWCSAQLPTRMDGLLYGAIAAVLVRRFSIERLTSPARWLFGISGALLIAIAFRVGPNFANDLTTLVGYPVLAIFFASLLVLALAPQSLFARFGRLAPLRFLGRYSYGLYVYHLIASPAGANLQVWLQVRTGSIVIGGILYTLTVFAGSLLMAVASYELYERRFLRLKRFFPYGRATQAAPGAAVIAT